MRVSYKNFGRPKCLAIRFTIYLPLRVRCPGIDFNKDLLFRFYAYVRPLGWDDRNPGYVNAVLCANRLEFRWPFYHTGEEYGDPPREFFVKITGNEVKRFFRRALIRLRQGKQVDKWDGFDFGEGDTRNDNAEVVTEPPNEDDEMTWYLVGGARAPFHATFSAHFAEVSQRFDEHNIEKLIRIPITDLENVWYGPRRSVRTS